MIVEVKPERVIVTRHNGEMRGTTVHEVWTDMYRAGPNGERILVGKDKYEATAFLPDNKDGTPGTGGAYLYALAGNLRPE